VGVLVLLFSWCFGLLDAGDVALLCKVALAFWSGWGSWFWWLSLFFYLSSR
jgi:hypothetical protein